MSTNPVSGIADSMDLIFPIEDVKRILEGKVESLTEKLEIMTEKHKVCTNNLRNTKLTLSWTKTENKALKSENAAHFSNIVKLNKDNTDLQEASKKQAEQLAIFELDKLNSNATIEMLEEEANSLKLENRKQTEQIAIFEEVTKSLKESKIQLETNLKKQAELHLDALKAKDSEIDEAHEFQRELSHSYERADGHNVRMRTITEGLTQENKELSLSVLVLEKEVDRLREALDGNQLKKKMKKCCFPF